MAEYAMPRCDEPFDFRRQAATYACFRPDYAPALYEAIAARTGPGAGRLALDLGCGPGLVAGALARRGWQVVGVDFSAPTLAEMARVLAPGGWAAIFWQFSAPGDPSMTLLREVFDDLGIAAPDVLFAPPAPLPPFAGSAFVAEPPLLFAAEHAFTPEALVGWVGTLEWVRRAAGPRHAEVLDALRAVLAARGARGVVQRTHQHLFLARRGAGA